MRSILEIIVALAIIFAIFNEAGLVKIEQKIISSIKKLLKNRKFLTFKSHKNSRLRYSIPEEISA